MLSAAEIDRFAETGFLVVEDVVPEPVLAAVEAEYAALLRELAAGWGLPWRGFWETLRAAQAQGRDWFQPFDISLPGEAVAPETPFHAGPAVFDLLTCPSLLDLAESVVGPEVTSNPIQHLRIKPPARAMARDERRAHVTLTAWHQDRGVAHAEADATDMVTIWVAMTDATVENGCLLVQPFEAAGGAQGMLPHCPMRQTAIPDAFLDADRARPVPVRRGGVVMLHPMVPHDSLDNRGDGFRWSFDLLYQRSGQPTGRAQFPAFTARSRTAPESELRDWRAWRAMWQEARAASAAAAHVPIHRWTSDSPHCA